MIQQSANSDERNVQRDNLFGKIKLLEKQWIDYDPEHEEHDVDRQEHQHDSDQVLVTQSLHILVLFMHLNSRVLPLTRRTVQM